MKRSRPIGPLDWALGTCWALALLLLVWATLGADWWSTALALDNPFREGTAYAAIVSEGRTLFEGYPWVPVVLILLMTLGSILTSFVLGPYAFLGSRRALFGAVAIGVAGLALTIVAERFESPVSGLVATNAWIPASLSWIVYFGVIVAAIVARDTQLELDTRPDSSAG